ncbi:MAG: hypothetical protein IPP14_15335 [Planctomycetes bacterium]|nr:hypothetical protein [Planctomycetota bacterium]
MTRLFALLLLAALFAAAFTGARAQDTPKQTAPVDYLIISADGLAEVASEWAKWRTDYGRVVQIVTLSEISKDKPPSLDAIRDTVLKQAGGEKLTPGFQVLLLGDCPVERTETYNPKIEIPWLLTPQFDSNPEPSARVRVPTDNYLADLIEDDDHKPDIAVGRIPARSAQEARIALAKVKAYETAPAGPWMRNLTFFAGEGRFGAQIDGMLENLFTQFAERTISQAYNVRMTYANIKSSYAYSPSRFSQKVIEEANAGSLLLCYMGHGQIDRLDNMYVKVEGERLRYPILTGDDVKDFKIKDGKLPVMLIIACETGHLDNDGPCLAERILFNESAPVAVLASSRDSHPYANVLLQKAFISEITQNHRATLGEAIMLAKRELVEAKDPDRKQLETMAMFILPKKAERVELNRSHISMYNLCGDPGLRMRYPTLNMTPASTGKAAAGSTADVSLKVPGTAVSGEGAEKACNWKIDLELQTRRTVIAGELKTVPEADLASADPAKRKAAEDIIAANHATSNDKRVANFSSTFQGLKQKMTKEELINELVYQAKFDNSLAPGDYILKVFALDEKAQACGFTSLEITVKEAPKKD